MNTDPHGHRLSVSDGFPVSLVSTRTLFIRACDQQTRPRHRAPSLHKTGRAAALRASAISSAKLTTRASNKRGPLHR